MSSTYGAIHMWLIAHYPRPVECLRCKAVGKMTGRRWSIEYALKPGLSHKKDISHYEPLCKSCHREQDYNDIHSPMRKNFSKGWNKRRKVHGLVPIDPITGRFISKNANS